jgi:5-hydroxyisourate hydrolase-like protein (transthyretin family)
MNYKIAFCLGFLFASMFGNAQSLSEIANKTLVIEHEENALEQFKENIYIHTDKDIYEPGEDLWFKAYILEAQELVSSTRTKIVFVQLTKQKEVTKEIIAKEKYEVIDGYTNGHIFLGNMLKSGSYQLEMYTKNTLESVSKKLVAVKRFEIKESIIPKILMDVEFSKKQFIRDEAVFAEVSVFSRSRVPYTNINVTADLLSGSERLDRIRVRTDENGEALIKFPAAKNKTATNIKLRVKYKGDEEFSLIEIPFKDMSNIQFGMYPEGGSLVENLNNSVAFKALDLNGRPIQVEGDLYEDGAKIQSFEAEHYGMGKFNFTPKPNKKYSVQLTNPIIDSVFKLPTILKEGVKLQVKKRDTSHIYFEIARTKNSLRKNIYIRAQSRGLVYWMATASLQNEHVQFKLPLEELPQGIAEITIFDDNFLPIAERLVYANLNQKLNFSVKEISKKSFKQKEKVKITFEVKDEFQSPVTANLSLSISDHLYIDKQNDYAIMPHYYLFSELRGHVYDASYYFDSKNKNRAQHLDLLLLTQGWRNYIWNKEQFYQSHNTIVFHPHVHGQVSKNLGNGNIQPVRNDTLQIAFPDIINQMEIDKNGNFELPIAAYKIAQGSEISIGYPDFDENVMVKIEDPFKKLEKIVRFKSHQFPQNDLPLLSKKQTSYDAKFSFIETNYLDEVYLSTYKERKKQEGNGRFYKPTSKDYVCFEYGILNCPNHRTGFKPIFGETYRLIDGGSVVYNFDRSKKANPYKSFAKIRGIYPEKEFYHPMYDQKPDDKLLPDNRKTLFWAPNLIPDKKGEITVEFYTSDIQTTFIGKLEGTDGFGILGAHTFQFEVK